MATILEQARERLTTIREQAEHLQKSRAYRTLRTMRTPLTPWLGALDAALAVERRRLERSRRKETRGLARELERVRAEVHEARSAVKGERRKRRSSGGGLGTVLIMAGAAYAAYRFLATRAPEPAAPAAPRRAPLERDRERAPLS